jgi:DNA-binding response OmpR family regulator
MSDTQKTVMIIEDEPDAAEMFGEMMRVSGFHVVKLMTSVPALEELAKVKPDLLILDIMMPEVSGLDILRQMRESSELSAIPVIIVSAKSMPSDVKTGIEAGASTYLTKPVGFLDLKRAVQQALGT